MRGNKLILRFHKLSALVKFFVALASTAIVFLLTRHQTAPVQFMSAWDCFSLMMLTLSWITMFTAHPMEITHIAQKQDYSRILIFLIILASSFVSLITIVLLLRELPSPGEKGYYYNVMLYLTSVGCSWLLIHTIFTSHYAHLFYAGKTQENIIKANKGGLEFPNEKVPDYFDFAYFSFVIGMTFQVSDVQVTSANIRRLVLLHGLISFLFNTIIVALSINIIAGLVQK